MNRFVARVQVFVRAEDAGAATMSAMSSLNFIMVTIGIILAVTGGLIMNVDSATFSAHLDWIPHAHVVLRHPQVAIAVGAVLVVLGIIYQPRRFRC